jgi:hypothetical protein
MLDLLDYHDLKYTTNEGPEYGKLEVLFYFYNCASSEFFVIYNCVIACRSKKATNSFFPHRLTKPKLQMKTNQGRRSRTLPLREKTIPYLIAVQTQPIMMLKKYVSCLVLFVWSIVCYF